MPKKGKMPKKKINKKYNVQTGFFFKAGDDYDSILKHHKNNTAKALEEWGNYVEETADRILELAEIIKGKAIQVTADTYNISFEDVDEDIKNQIVDAGLGVEI